jgi:hypothetical protein
MRNLYLVLLGCSGLLQLGFGVAFLVAPQTVFRMGEIQWLPAFAGTAINLGCLVALCGVLSFQALSWIRAGVPAGHRIADLLGLMLLLMGALEGLHRLWLPLAVDGGRGAILIGLAAFRLAVQQQPRSTPEQ